MQNSIPAGIEEKSFRLPEEHSLFFNFSGADLLKDVQSIQEPKADCLLSEKPGEQPSQSADCSEQPKRMVITIGSPEDLQEYDKKMHPNAFRSSRRMRRLSIHSYSPDPAEETAGGAGKTDNVTTVSFK